MVGLHNGDGDLTQRLEVHSSDDLGQIAGFVNTFIENLQSMMIQIEGSTLTLKEDVNALNVQRQQAQHKMRPLWAQSLGMLWCRPSPR